jgi:hypothetical protein
MPSSSQCSRPNPAASAWPRRIGPLPLATDTWAAITAANTASEMMLKIGIQPHREGVRICCHTCAGSRSVASIGMRAIT